MDRRWIRLGKLAFDVVRKGAEMRSAKGRKSGSRKSGGPSSGSRPGGSRSAASAGTGVTMPRFPAPDARPQPEGARGRPTRGEVGTAEARPQITYAPRRDDDADPGEVVWAWVPYEDDPSQGKDRPLLVIGHLGEDVAALQLTSRGHDDRHHHGLGSGSWDHRGRPSWVKLDRLVRLDPDGIRREGAILDERRFRAVVDAWEAY